MFKTLVFAICLALAAAICGPSDNYATCGCEHASCKSTVGSGIISVHHHPTTTVAAGLQHKCKYHEAVAACKCICGDQLNLDEHNDWYNLPTVDGAIEFGNPTTDTDTVTTDQSTSQPYSSGIPGNCMPNVLCPTGVNSNCNHPSTSYADLASAQADCDVTPTCYAVFNIAYPSSNSVWSNQNIWQMRTCNPGSSNCNQPATNGGTPSVIAPYSNGGCGNYNSGNCVSGTYPNGGGCAAYFKDNGGYNILGY